MKAGLDIVMRPGWDWRVRFWGGLQMYSVGYENELVVKMVNGMKVPIGPSEFARLVQQRALNEVARAGEHPRIFLTEDEVDDLREEAELAEKEIDDADLDAAGAQKLLAKPPYVRRLFEEFENLDRCLVRVRPECLTIKLVGMPLAEALKKKMVTPIVALSELGRKKLGGKTLMYVPFNPLPATLEALLRHTDEPDDIEDDEEEEQTTGRSKGSTKPARQPVQLEFAWLKEFGISDGELAAKIVDRPEVRRARAELEKIETRHERDRERANEKLRAAVEAANKELTGTPPPPAAQQEPLFKPESPLPAQPDKPDLKASAPLNPRASSSSTNTDGVSRGADTKSLNHNGQELINGFPTGGTPPTPPGRRDQDYGPEVYQLHDLLKGRIPSDLEGCAALITRCRQGSPRSTITAICQCADALIKIARSKGDPFAWLIWKLPKQFDGQSGRASAEPPERMERGENGRPYTAAELEEMLAAAGNGD